MFLINKHQSRNGRFRCHSNLAGAFFWKSCGSVKNNSLFWTWYKFRLHRRAENKRWAWTEGRHISIRRKVILKKVGTAVHWKFNLASFHRIILCFGGVFSEIYLKQCSLCSLLIMPGTIRFDRMWFWNFFAWWCFINLTLQRFVESLCVSAVYLPRYVSNSVLCALCLCCVIMPGTIRFDEMW